MNTDNSELKTIQVRSIDKTWDAFKQKFLDFGFSSEALEPLRNAYYFGAHRVFTLAYAYISDGMHADQSIALLKNLAKTIDAAINEDCVISPEEEAEFLKFSLRKETAVVLDENVMKSSWFYFRKYATLPSSPVHFVLSMKRAFFIGGATVLQIFDVATNPEVPSDLCEFILIKEFTSVEKFLLEKTTRANLSSKNNLHG